jgi:hypothetical protein
LAIAGGNSQWALEVVSAIAGTAAAAEALTLAGHGHAVPDETLSRTLITYFE